MTLRIYRAGFSLVEAPVPFC